MKILLTGTLLSLLMCACATTHAPETFLQTDSVPWSRYLDEKVSIDVDHVDFQTLFCHTPALADLNIVIRSPGKPKAGVYEESFSTTTSTEQEEIRIENMRITLHADSISRRELLYRIAHACKIDMSWDKTNGFPRAVALDFQPPK